jgi:hypothetical protein
MKHQADGRTQSAQDGDESPDGVKSGARPDIDSEAVRHPLIRDYGLG